MIKAIETVYNGYRFRSRLEARWAVFFNALEIKWEYEKEGYDLGGSYYLPDFWLPKYKYWIEIKGEFPSEIEKEKCRSLAERLRNPVFIFWGEIPLTEQKGQALRFESASNGACEESGFYWEQCPLCGKPDIVLSHHVEAFKNCHCSDYITHATDEDALAFRIWCMLQKEYHLDERALSDISFCVYQYSLAWYQKLRLSNIPYSSDIEKMQAAYTAARQARFEYGERGR